MSLGQIIKKMASEAGLANGPLEFIEGVIHKAPPSMELKLKGNEKLIIPSDFIRVSEHLTRHSRRVDISSTNIDGTLSRAGDPPHAHSIQSLSVSNAVMEFTDELKKGDKVMVAAIQGGQSFFIIDRFKKG